MEEELKRVAREFIEFMDSCANWPDTTAELIKLEDIKDSFSKILEDGND